MKTVLDLECHIEEYIIDFSEHGALTAPVIRNGLVLCINYNLTNDNPNETAIIVERGMSLPFFACFKLSKM